MQHDPSTSPSLILRPNTTAMRIAQHLLFWMVAMAAMHLLYSRIYDSTPVAGLLLLYVLPVYAVSVYFTLYVTIPRALHPRRYGKLFLFIAYTVLGVLFLIIAQFLFLLVGLLELPGSAGYVFPRKAMDVVLLSAGVFIVTIMAVAVKLLRHWFEEERTSERLKRERLEAELAMLRAQVHPHFLFNTLNNLYALTMKKSDQASDVVLKLSEMLHYMLYESRADTVPVEREARLIEEYVELERLRYGPVLRVQFIHDLELTHAIPPLLFLPLVENSFKHGVSKCGDRAWVEIDMQSQASELVFSVKNSIPPDAEDWTENSARGIGLRNVRERLRILFPDQHRFEIEQTKEMFLVSMRIIFPATLRRNAE